MKLPRIVRLPRTGLAVTDWGKGYDCAMHDYAKPYRDQLVRAYAAIMFLSNALDICRHESVACDALEKAQKILDGEEKK
jgi:hypothetical protein